MSNPPLDRRRQQQGFTLIELLVVVAVIGILATIGIPAMKRALLRSRMARMSNDGSALYKAFVQYNVDHSVYPAAATFDLVSLDPLTSNGYLHSASAIVATLSSRQLTAYDSPAGGGIDGEFWAVLSMAADPSVQLVVGDTTQFPGFVGQSIAGLYYIVGTNLVDPDEDVTKMMGL